MKSNLMKRISSILIFCAALFLAIEESYAQPGPPMGGGTPACWPPPCTIPLDGGISLLIAAGVALGGKKFYDFRKSAKNQ